MCVGSLAALVYQHSITPLALPCKLLLPTTTGNCWHQLSWMKNLGLVSVQLLTVCCIISLQFVYR